MNDPVALATAIEKNVDDFWSDVISYDVFTARAQALWDEALAAGVVDSVLPLLRISQRN
jgi:hypothetical protein